MQLYVTALVGWESVIAAWEARLDRGFWNIRQLWAGWEITRHQRVAGGAR